MIIRTTNVANGVRLEIHEGGGRWSNLGTFKTLTAGLDSLRAKFGPGLDFHFA